MPDGLYERDVLVWSQHQADLLRRPGRGERVNDVDWVHVAEEIEDLGLSELHSVESYLTLIMVNLLKIRASPDNDAVDHWYEAIAASQGNAGRRFTPPLRQWLDLGALYADAIRQMRAGDRRNTVQRPWPDANPFTLDDLLNEDGDVLVRHLPAADAG